MKQIKFNLLCIVLFCSQSGFGQWVEYTNIGDQYIETLNFLDDELGYALMKSDTDDDPSIMKTVDGGENWIELNLPIQTGELQDICFYEEGAGLIVIRDLDIDEVPTMIFQTINDGENWEDISPDVTAKGVGLGKCHFINHNIGFLITDKFLYKTSNGGESWTATEFNNYILSIDFLDAEHGVLGTWDGTFGYKGGMLITNDGGLTWSKNVLNENYTSILEVRQISNTVALAAPVHSWASIQAGKFYKTTDGVNWTAVEVPISGENFTLRQIDFKDEMNGVICVGNTMITTIYSTNNGGQTWLSEGTITSTYDLDLQLTPNSGYLGGETGAFYKRIEPSSTSELSTKEDIFIYPSPIKSGGTISWNSSEGYTQLSIVNQEGRTIHQQYLNGNQATLPYLSFGVYLIQLSNGKRSSTTKLIVE